MDGESARLRVRGYREGLAAAGLPHEPDLEVVTTGWGPSGADGTVRALVNGRRMWTPCAASPTRWRWVRCTHGGHRSPGAGRHRRRRLRRRLGVRLFVPALTTIGFDKAELAPRRSLSLAARIADPSRPPETVTLP